MSYLLDTHTFLWFVCGDKQLPQSIKTRIEDINQPCFLSIASLWEITIKQQIGKLILDITIKDLFDYAERNQIEIIQINYNHLLELSKLPSYHNDPFDRLILSQVSSENLVIISKDKEFENYPVEVIWS